MLLKHAEKIALDTLKEVAAGGDPVGDQKQQRERDKRTVGKLCEEYCEEMERTQGLRPLTLRNVFENHLGELRNMQDVELCQRQNAIVTRLREISQMQESIDSGKAKAKRNKGRRITGGPRVAASLRAALQSVYKWGLGRYPDDITVNPINGIWAPKIPEKTRARCLSLQELRNSTRLD